MPLPQRNVECYVGTVGREFNGFRDGALVIIELLNQTAAQADNCLRGLLVSMDRQWRARLDGIEHTLRMIFRCISKVQIHSKAR